MYIQITERCNMTCEHCCYSCTETGRDMPRSTFRRALQLAKEYGMSVTLGGGEPTLHKLFLEYLCEAISESDADTRPHIVTNGSVTNHAILIAKLTNANVIFGELSLDDYHDPIDIDVVEAFQMKDRYNSMIRDVSRHVRNVGRAVETGAGMEDGCVCDDFFVAPDGIVYQCGCPDAPAIGDVWEGFTEAYALEGDNMYCCHKQMEVTDGV